MAEHEITSQDEAERLVLLYISKYVEGKNEPEGVISDINVLERNQDKENWLFDVQYTSEHPLSHIKTVIKERITFSKEDGLIDRNPI